MEHSIPLAFPSRHFPSADLRLGDDASYECQCPGCKAPIAVQLTEQLNYGKGIPIECPSCGAGYRLRVELTETSPGAYRLRVLGVDGVTTSGTPHL